MVVMGGTSSLMVHDVGLGGVLGLLPGARDQMTRPL